jgi:hypothetical protein
MTPRILAASLLATAMAAAPLAAQNTGEEDVVIVPVENEEQSVGAEGGAGGFTAAQGAIAVGTILLLGAALGSGDDGGSSTPASP